MAESKFFAAGSSESESSDSGDEQPAVSKPATITTKSFMFSDDEEETKRVVRSQKDKRFEELTNSIKQLKNHKKIKDISKVLTEFENLGKAFSKAKAVVDKEGIPQFYIRSLTELEDFVKENWEDTEGRKKLSKVNARALATLRQKLRKYNKDFEEDILKYRENPVPSGESDQEESGSEDEDDDDDDDRNDFHGVEDFTKKKVLVEKSKPPKTTDAGYDENDDDDDDSIDWDSSEDESSSSDSDIGGEGGPMQYRLSMFLKKDKGPDEKGKHKKKTKEKKTTKLKSKEGIDDGGGWTEVKGSSLSASDKAKQLFPKDTEITHAVVLKKLHEILSARGKKGTDRTDQIEFLKQLRVISDNAKLGAGMTVKLLFNIISSIFDYNPNVATCMKPEMWQECLKQISELLDILINNQDTLTIGENLSEESENVEDLTQNLKVRGCPLVTIERMDDEFTKMLQGCDCHSTEYVARLRDEEAVCELITKLQGYLEVNGSRPEICRVYLRHIEHLYYKVKSEQKSEDANKNTEVETSTDENTETPIEKPKTKEASSKVSIDDMCKFIYSRDTSDRIRTRAMLCHVYHHALNDRWFEARDLMLMSHLQESIQHSDIPTQILYNRTMVQLGLCAFRHGMIKDAHNALHDVQSSGRAKELLAQGLMQQRQFERTPEQEKIEKRRQVPFHMHINLELLECVYLTSAMLMEIPWMAAHAYDYRPRIFSKSFHYQLRQSEKQTLVGPPESMREHVVAASKAMKKGDWRQCRDYILAVKVWKLFRQPEQVQEMLSRKIQEESLRTYLFTYNSVYDSLSLHLLAEMFDLPPSVVHSTISKMIINEELQASWDEPTQTVVMHRGAEPSLLQNLALQLADKVSNLVENNERIYDTRHGGFVQFKDRQGQGRYRRQNQQHYDRQDRSDKQDRQDRHNWQERHGRQYDRDRSYQQQQAQTTY
ncbi:eukaryotic translation initiation factor 3 subunit C-like [Pocillopora damicornis]|uniref:eukaryotic translation initiation factor 3 subunit C-like n=1 Tax=Pocillopora damicornis TaxID=46731 RepID=UPI000F55793A|nr:eukaryotic translation initiation factor 3 subunit C-like [Pocillopora damicornis]